VAAAKSAIEFDPGRARYWDRYGKARSAAGENREAGAAFAQAAALVPYLYANWNNLAVTRALQAKAGDQSRGGWPAAFTAVQEGLRRDPDNTTLLYTYAFILDSTGDYVGALDTAVRTVRLFQRDVTYDVLVAQTSAHVADASLAREQIRLALTAKESSTLPIAAARAALRMGDRIAAQGHLQQLFRYEPDNEEALDLMMVTRASLGN
jgi:tetratricopeptide (TPR) repeat protein